MQAKDRGNFSLKRNDAYRKEIGNENNKTFTTSSIAFVLLIVTYPSEQ